MGTLIYFSVKYLRYAMGRYQTQKFNKRIGVLKSKRGFTLVEMMVALVIASIIVTAFYSLFTYMTRSFTTQQVTSDVQQRLRTGIDFVERDLRMAGFDPAGTNEAGILAASTNSIQFTMDLDEDSLFNSAGENITYNFTNRMLQRTDNNVTYALNQDLGMWVCIDITTWTAGTLDARLTQASN